MKTSICIKLVLFFVVMSFCSFKSALSVQDWVELGSRKVNFGLDKDEIEVRYHEGTFTAIKLEVSEGALNMHRCVIHFENGTKQEVELRHTFNKGSESRVVDLVGNKRFIKKIDFWYDSKDLQFKRATLSVFGRK